MRRCQYRGCGRYFGRLRQQDCLQHHKRLLSAKRNNEGPCFYTRTEGSGEFLFRPSCRHPLGYFDRGCVFARPDAPDRQVDCDEATRFADVSYHLMDVAADVLLKSVLTE